MSQGDPSLQKFALKQQEPPNVNMEVDTPCLPTPEDHVAEETLPDLASSCARNQAPTSELRTPPSAKAQTPVCDAPSKHTDTGQQPLL